MASASRSATGASSRAIYAQGSLRASRFLVKQAPGLYGMNDVLGFSRCAERGTPGTQAGPHPLGSADVPSDEGADMSGGFSDFWSQLGRRWALGCPAAAVCPSAAGRFDLGGAAGCCRACWPRPRAARVLAGGQFGRQPAALQGFTARPAAAPRRCRHGQTPPRSSRWRESRPDPPPARRAARRCSAACSSAKCCWPPSAPPPLPRALRHGLGHLPRPRVHLGGRQHHHREISGPVGEALIMTAAGLAVAIPAVLAYNLFGKWVAACEPSWKACARPARVAHRQGLGMASFGRLERSGSSNRW